MNYLLILSLVFSSCPILVDGGENYNGQGVLFTPSYSPSFAINDLDELCYLDGCTIESVEEVFHKQFYDLLSNDDRIKWSSIPENPRKHYRKYNRQYIGYSTTAGDTIVLINLLNFSKKGKAKKMFPTWKQEFVIGFGEFYEKNTLLITVNLTRHKLSFFQD